MQLLTQMLCSASIDAKFSISNFENLKNPKFTIFDRKSPLQTAPSMTAGMQEVGTYLRQQWDSVPPFLRLTISRRKQQEPRTDRC